MLTICLKTFGNVFGHFEKNDRFSIFLKFFQVSTLQDALGNFLSRKNLETKSKLLWTHLRTILDTFENSKFFRFFFEFLQFSISRLHWSQKSQKNYLKQVWTLLETFFGVLKLWKYFHFIENFRRLEPSSVHWKKKLRKKYFKTSLDTLGIVFRDFGTLKFFPFLWIFFSLQGALGRAFSVEKISQNILQQCFWKRFWTILKVSKFFHFSEFFPSVDPPRCTGHICSKKKITSKQVQNVFGHIRNYEIFHFFPIFSFRDPPGCTGQIFYRKKYLETCSIHDVFFSKKFSVQPGGSKNFKKTGKTFNFSKWPKSVPKSVQTCSEHVSKESSVKNFCLVHRGGSRLKKNQNRVEEISGFQKCPKTFPNVQTCFEVIFLKISCPVGWKPGKIRKKSKKFWILKSVHKCS